MNEIHARHHLALQDSLVRILKECRVDVQFRVGVDREVSIVHSLERSIIVVNSFSAVVNKPTDEPNFVAVGATCITRKCGRPTNNYIRVRWRTCQQMFAKSC